MKLSKIAIQGTLLILAILLQLSCANTYREVYKKKLEVEPGTRIHLYNINGSVEVEGWEENALFIEAEKKVQGASPDVREKLKDVHIDVEVNGNEVNIEANYPKHGGSIWEWIFGDAYSVSVKYHLKVPRDCLLKIETTNGSIHVQNIQGKVNLSATNGKLEVENVAGAVSAETVNGKIQVSFDSLAIDSEMKFSTTNGGIQIYLPEDARCTIQAETTNGSIETDFPLQIKGEFVSKRVRGTINGGGAMLKLETVNGSIEILKKGKVELEDE